ncbi:MAG: VOC family protein [Acidimicrobiia bacterium]|nr:VOC family protein [Acidimicrobiia bacterium]
MPEPVHDPFRSLERPVEPIAPSAAFTAELRGRVERALGRATTSPRLAHVPSGFTAITPYLAVRDARAAITFYQDVFGARLEDEPIIMDDGRVGHSALRIGDAVFFMADEFPEIGVVSPESNDGWSTSFVVYVPDVDAAFERAVARGAVVERPVADGQHGSRAGWLRDPFGHRWNIGTPESTDASATVDLGERAPGPAAASEPVQLGYYTLGSPDPSGSQAFFAGLFRWRFEGGGHIADSDPPGGIEPDGQPSTLYFRIGEIESYAARVRELGGTTAPLERNPSGLSIACEDPAGVRFILWEPAPGY